MITKSILKEYANRRCPHLVYLMLDETRLLEFFKKLMENKIDFEFRLTLIEEYHDIDSIYEIGKLLEGSKKLFLQQYKLSDGVRDKSLHPVSEEVANKYVEILSQYVENVELRGY